jgi:hypothetical protein
MGEPGFRDIQTDCGILAFPYLLLTLGKTLHLCEILHPHRWEQTNKYPSLLSFSSFLPSFLSSSSFFFFFYGRGLELRASKLFIFEIGSCFMPRPAYTMTLLFVLPQVAGMTGKHYHTQLWVEIVSCELFAWSGIEL